MLICVSCVILSYHHHPALVRSTATKGAARPSRGFPLHCYSVLHFVALPDVTVDDVDVALHGDNVTLTCSATGDPPLTYQWTMQDSTALLSTDMTLELMNITEDQFGTYICNVTNALGEGASNVTIERASEFVFQIM